MNDQNLQIAAPNAAFTRSAAPSGVISLNGSDKVTALLAVITNVYPDAPHAMLATAASHFANYIGVPLSDLKISTVKSAIPGFGAYLGKQRKKNGEKLGRNSVRSYVNYSQMLVRQAMELGWSQAPSKVELAWRAMSDGVDWAAIKDGSALRKQFNRIGQYATAAEVLPEKLSDDHLKGYEDLKVNTQRRHRKYARHVISGFRLGITRANLRDKFPLISHPLDDHYFGIAVDNMPEPMRSQLGRVIDHRLKAGTRRLPQVVKGDRQKRINPDKVKIRPISGKNAEETASKVLGFTQLEVARKLGIDIDLEGPVDLLDVFSPKVIDPYISWQLDEKGRSGRGLNGLSVVCASLDMFPDYKEIDFTWFRELNATIPDDDEEAVIDRKSEKYLPHTVLCGIPAKIEEERRHVEKGTVEYARLTHDMLLMTWMPTFAWRQRNVRECSLGTAKRCRNIFKARLDEYRNVAIPEEIQAKLALNPDAEVWQIYFSKDQVKTGQTIRGIVPLHAVALLEEYLELRHLLVGTTDPGTLFLNRAGGKRRGGPLSKESFGNLIGGLTQKYEGRWCPPHLYRDALAFHWLDEHPEDYLSLSKHLWHRNINTTVKRYGHKYDESYGLKKVGGWTGSFFKPRS